MTPALDALEDLPIRRVQASRPDGDHRDEAE
jgi:hypothetical protein